MTDPVTVPIIEKATEKAVEGNLSTAAFLLMIALTVTFSAGFSGLAVWIVRTGIAQLREDLRQRDSTLVSLVHEASASQTFIKTLIDETKEVLRESKTDITDAGKTRADILNRLTQLEGAFQTTATATLAALTKEFDEAAGEYKEIVILALRNMGKEEKTA